MGLKGTVVIGVHGLGNKPPRRQLAAWWRLAMTEGMRLAGYAPGRFRFRLVYWADLLHAHPVDQRIPESDPWTLERPYEPYPEPPPLRKPSPFRRRVLDELERLIDRIASDENGFRNVERLGNRVVGLLFRDLQIYYHGTCIDRRRRVRPAREVIREELARVLRRFRGSRIILLAHSMGSIIACDVLASPTYPVKVDTLVTMGSPLGLPPVKARLVGEHFQDGESCRTPEAVRRRWINASDLQDQICLNYDLHDDFQPNSHGVAPADLQVYNAVRAGVWRDPHNIYGYLHTPEVASRLARLLRRRKTKTPRGGAAG